MTNDSTEKNMGKLREIFYNLDQKSQAIVVVAVDRNGNPSMVLSGSNSVIAYCLQYVQAVFAKQLAHDSLVKGLGKTPLEK